MTTVVATFPGSTSLSSASYDDVKQELDVTFATGATYTYTNVPQRIFDGLRDAASAGQYFHRNIKDQYA